MCRPARTPEDRHAQLVTISVTDVMVLGSFTTFRKVWQKARRDVVAAAGAAVIREGLHEHTAGTGPAKRVAGGEGLGSGTQVASGAARCCVHAFPETAIRPACAKDERGRAPNWRSQKNMKRQPETAKLGPGNRAEASGTPRSRPAARQLAPPPPADHPGAYGAATTLVEPGLRCRISCVVEATSPPTNGRRWTVAGSARTDFG